MKHSILCKEIAALILSIGCFNSFGQQYDLNIYDQKKRTNSVISIGQQASMWNAAWSNSGKKIACDVYGAPAAPFLQSIFIIDVQTGQGTPLAGAENGNDAAWSPNGETIAFDKWEPYPQSIYMVPAAGGISTLFRYNAHHASWSPAGDKIAFDDNNGYIATKNISTGVETFVTWYGDRPSWSPNGKYIAFDGWWWIGGGIWIIEVDVAGNPVGWPVQLTTSGYVPTWSTDSKEIAFINDPGGDPDVYTIPFTGGVAKRLCGRVGGFDKGDYDPAYSNNGQFMAYSSYTDAPFAGRSPENKFKTNIPGKTGPSLRQNYPNPFSTETKIAFSIAEPTHVVLDVYNMAGQKITTLVNADYMAGTYTASWNGKDRNGNALVTGIYNYQLQTSNGRLTKRMSLIR